MSEKLQIKPATGKLGILTPGMGAVSSTFIAGVCAIRKGLRLPIGSFTQMGHIRLGKRTEDRQPLVKNFVPLTDLSDIAFGGWDIFEDSVYDAAMNAGVLEKDLLDELKPELEQIKPMKARLRPVLRQEAGRQPCQDRHQDGAGGAGHAGHGNLQEGKRL